MVLNENRLVAYFYVFRTIFCYSQPYNYGKHQIYIGYGVDYLVAYYTTHMYEPDPHIYDI